MVGREQDQVIIGRIGAPHGVKGWVKIWSFTDPIDNIFRYHNWRLQLPAGSKAVEVAESSRQGGGLIARLDGCTTPEQARLYCNAEVAVYAEELPPLAGGDYYWHQLEGLLVLTNDGDIVLGRVARMMATGANDVIVVVACEGSFDQRERLIPWRPGQVVKSVDLDARQMLVDWDPAF